MENEMTDQECNEQRLDAIEAVLELVLPMLIADSPRQREIRAALLGLPANPPTGMAGNTSLGALADAIGLRLDAGR